MALVVRSVYNGFQALFQEHSDPRTADFPFMGDFGLAKILAIMIIYLFTVKKWGPKLMEKRTPFELKTTMNIFNVVQVLLNVYIAIFGGYYSYWQSDFSWSCQPIDHTVVTPERLNLVFVSYVYFLSKILDLADTIFFVLRKKNNQITFLHTYHHAGMILGTYIFSRFMSGSHSTLLGVLNAFVHVIMYTYYFLTSFNSDLKNSIWWKKHITQLQLFQFLILILHFAHPLIRRPDCSHPRILLCIAMMQNIFMFCLFFDFYLKAYRRKKIKRESTD
ncbi:elongation of very long chain fatty acids protein AAEL008004-like [Phlebotomus argentipes]|uniref:elongation of very long chain fatty acids protein AAEL008004-like n=1 Tax=Phlebotomus argentipes TaxID=94469 RepID=UPI0028937508|nr:elongation of very long chain fatty acids protein AAEL008004-like [Phlebotomus argentipes]